MEAAAGPPDGRLGFAGHQTFPFRHGWLKKAVDAVRADPFALSSERAIVILGVGKNMVESIRHWGLATGVLEETSRHGLAVTTLGERLFERWDPFLEDPASIWLLHWLLVTNPNRAAVWHLAFTAYPHPEFTRSQLADWIVGVAQRRGSRVLQSTVARDVDCLVRSYVPSTADRKATPEDTFECPLTDLSLIGGPYEGDIFRFAIGPKRTLPPIILGYALLRFAGHLAPGRMTWSIGECLYEPGSPGQAFKLDEDTLVESIERLAEITNGGIQFDETSGLRQVYFRDTVDDLQLLARYYETGRER